MISNIPLKTEEPKLLIVHLMCIFFICVKRVLMKFLQTVSLFYCSNGNSSFIIRNDLETLHIIQFPPLIIKQKGKEKPLY